VVLIDGVMVMLSSCRGRGGRLEWPSSNPALTGGQAGIEDGK